MAEIKVSELPKSRQAARLCGSIYFFSGDVCPHGHIDKRKTVNGTCFPCDRDRISKCKENNKLKIQAQGHARYLIKKDKMNLDAKKWREANKAKHKANQSRWKIAQESNGVKISSFG